MPDTPKRIQRRRTKGSKTPPNTVYCGRPGPWGNRYRATHITECVDAYHGTYVKRKMSRKESAQESVRGFGWYQLPTMDVEPLRGKNLSCWCKLCDRHKDGKPLDEVCADCTPCHIDVLGEFLYGTKGVVK